MLSNLKSRLDPILQNAIKNRVFSGCSIGFFTADKGGNSKGILSYGTNDLCDDSIPVDKTSVFDLASLTKPLVTALSIQVLIDERTICLEDRLDMFFSEVPQDKAGIRLSELIKHGAGLPSHRPYFKDLINIPISERKTRLARMILEEKLEYSPGSNSVYSDLGFILLSMIIEKVTHQGLDYFWNGKVVEPLQLQKELYFPGLQKLEDPGRFVTTGRCSWSEKSLSGIVHDDNCRAIGGVAGHAGLFGTAKALLSLCEFVVMLYNGLIEHPYISGKSFVENVNIKSKGFRFGFDTPTGTSPSCGRYFSENTIGHLGFTGTSFWLDLEKMQGILFLTNRVYCGDDLRKIREIRPRIHDTIMQYLK